MKKAILIDLVLIFLCSCAMHLPAPQKDLNQIQIFGDSNATGISNVFESALRDNGYDYQVSWISIPGETAEDIVKTKTDILTDLVAKYKPRYCIISAGGNDFLNKYRPGMDDFEFRVLSGQIAGDIMVMSNTIKKANPETIVIVLGLDYINLEDSRENIVGYWRKPNIYYWEKLGKPDPETINKLMIALGEVIKKACVKSDLCRYSNNHGYLQSVLGIGKAPGNYPDYEPFAGGDPTKPTPSQMMDLDIIQGVEMVDAIHPNEKSYYLLADRLIKNFIR